MTSINSDGQNKFLQLWQSFLGSPTVPLKLPALQKAVDPGSVCHAAGVARVAELGQREVAQITIDQLNNCDDFYVLLRTAIENRQLMWVVETPTAIERETLLNHAATAAHPLNNEATIWGINVQQMTSVALNTYAGAKEKLTNVDVTSAPVKIRHILRMHGVHVQYGTLAKRLFTDPRFWVYVITFIYSALRAVPVLWIPHFRGSVWVLWTIDLVTALPYTWGILQMITARRTTMRLLGLVIATITFIAPYVYFFMHGKRYPPEIIFVIFIMISASIAIELGRVLQNQWLRRRYATDESR